MLVFVAVLLKFDRRSIDLGAVASFLPARPRKTQSWQGGRVNLVCHHFGHDGTGRLAVGNGLAAAVDGILLPRNEDAPHDPLSLLRDGHDAFDGYGEYAAVWTDGARLFARSNPGGSHNIYWTETPDLIAISNRSVCLLGVRGVSHALERNAVRWKCFMGYVGGNLTAIEGVYKSRPGTRITASAIGLNRDEPRYEEFRSPAVSEGFASNPLGTVQNEVDRIATYMSRAHAYTGSLEIDVPLSGGKDSRTILALLLHAGLREHIGTIWTRGPHYSPEVLAARDLCDAIGYGPHEVRRPAHSSQSSVSALTAVRTLQLHEGTLSLYDFCGIALRTDFRFQGHELGLRAGRFAKNPTLDLGSFVAGALKTWSNPLGVVRDEHSLRGEFHDFFVDLHDRGVPISDLGDLYSLWDRLPNWAAVMSSTDYFGGAISNPLLDGEIFKFAFSVPAEFRRVEAFQYLAQARGAPALLGVPYADQEWPAKLGDYLAQIRVTYPFQRHAPYRSRPSFPNLRNPYIANVKLDYLRSMAGPIADMLEKHRSYFDDLIDVDSAKEKVLGMTEPSFPLLYSTLGLYSAVLLREYGTAVFDLSAQQGIAKDLQARISPTGARQFTTEEVLVSALERHEFAIADLVREVRRRSSLPQ